MKSYKSKLANVMQRIIIVIFMLATATVAGNAQFFIEGSVGAQYWGGTNTIHYLKVSPLVGYQMNENLALGINASFISYTTRTMNPDPDTGDEVEWEYKSPGWSLCVFDRYKLWGTKKISLLLESSIYMSEYKSSQMIGYRTTKNETQSSIGVDAFPLISYELSDRFSITLSTDFLRLNLYSLTEKNKETGLKKRSGHFEFNGQTTILNSLSEIRLGIIYHFKKSGK